MSSRQSSRLMPGVLVCSSAAMRRAPCRRALPRGSSSTPMVVRIASFYRQSSATWLEPCHQHDHCRLLSTLVLPAQRDRATTPQCSPARRYVGCVRGDWSRQRCLQEDMRVSGVRDPPLPQGLTEQRAMVVHGPQKPRALWSQQSKQRDVHLSSRDMSKMGPALRTQSSPHEHSRRRRLTAASPHWTQVSPDPTHGTMTYPPSP